MVESRITESIDLTWLCTFKSMNKQTAVNTNITFITRNNADWGLIFYTSKIRLNPEPLGPNKYLVYTTFVIHLSSVVT